MTNELKPIVNTSRDGDFVLEGQTLASNEGFRNVSKIWYDKTVSFDTAREQLAEGRKSREDIKCKPCDMVPYFDEETGEVGFEYVDGRKFDYTEHALCQYGSRTNICSTYLKQAGSPIRKPNGDVKRMPDKGDMETLYRVLKNGHRHMTKGKTFLWRTYDHPESGLAIRACLTEGYAIINNEWYLDTLEEVVPDGRLSHFSDFADADTIYGNLLIPDTIREEKDSDYGGMVSLSNCEIGIRNCRETPGLFRAICMNGCIWGYKKGITRKTVHRGKIDYVQLKKAIAKGIEEQIPLMAGRVDKLLATRQWKLQQDVSMAQLMTYMCANAGLGGKRIEEVFSQYNKNTAKEKTAFDAIDALTRASQSFDAKSWVSTDTIAAEIIEGGLNGWERMNRRAKEISKDDLARMLKKNVELVA